MPPFTVSRVLVLIAVILFILAAFGLPTLGQVGTVPLGLGFFAASFLLGWPGPPA
jgi:hypothetical protein